MKYNEINIKSVTPILDEYVKDTYSSIKYEADNEIKSRFLIKSSYLSNSKLYEYKYNHSYSHEITMKCYGQDKELRNLFIKKLEGYKDPNGIDEKLYIHIYKMDDKSIIYRSSYSSRILNHKIMIEGLLVKLPIILAILICIIFIIHNIIKYIS